MTKVYESLADVYDMFARTNETCYRTTDGIFKSLRLANIAIMLLGLTGIINSISGCQHAQRMEAIEKRIDQQPIKSEVTNGS